MKNIYTLIVLFCCTLTFSSAQTVPPYFNDFETDTIGWSVSANPANRWQWNTTNTGACSGISAWGIQFNSSGFYNPTAAFYSPVFDFSTTSNATLSFAQNYDCDLFNAGTRIEYSTNGATWLLLGNIGQANNWYNAAIIGSSGMPGWTGYLGGCINSSILLNNLNGFSAVQFRFVFSSDSILSTNTYIIDDFCICTPPCVCNNSVGINQVLTDNSFNVFPNPSKGMFTIETKDNSGFNVLLYDLVGKEILNRNLNGTRAIIETRNICSGIYFLKISDGEKQFIRKLIIE
ncbi:MAG: T9SS type A sorting domain-containing protein [Bacteroidia bacterium]